MLGVLDNGSIALSIRPRIRMVARKKSGIGRKEDYFDVLFYAGRRTDFRDKKSRDFSGEIFLERNYWPRTGFSGSNP